jgi:lysine decarboxylase
MKPRDAWFARSKTVPLAGARGEICAEAVAVYPPGIPVINPGEEITGEIHEYLRMVSEAGLACQGPSDPTLKTIKIVIE